MMPVVIAIATLGGPKYRRVIAGGLGYWLLTAVFAVYVVSVLPPV